MSRWPRDNQKELIAFYGNPGTGEVERQLVPVVPPFKMYFDGTPIKHLLFHRKAASALLAALNEIWVKCGRKQATVDKYGLSKCNGTYNKRLVRGSKTTWSNHAFGAAIDINADENGMNTNGNTGTMPAFAVAAFERQGFRWGGRYKVRKDPMHFEACDNGRGVMASLSEALVPSAEAYDSSKEFEWPEGTDNSGVVLEGADDAITSEVTNTAKTLLKSKIGWTQTILAFFGIGSVGSQVDVSFFDKLKAVVTSPGFMLLVMIVCVGLTIYWRWKDHGRGQKS